jgi:hypothetical protein
MESKEPESLGQEFSWWREFFSGDNSKVNSMTVLSLVIAAPVVLLAGLALVYHIFYLHKGLDSPSVQLFIALITAATGGLGASMYAKSTLSVTRMESAFTKKNVPDPKPDNPDAKGET